MADSTNNQYTFNGYRPADAMDESLLRKYVPNFDALREQNFSLQDGQWFLRPGATDPFSQYTFGSAENGANKMLTLRDPGGKLLGIDQYYYDEPSLGRSAVEGATMIGGAAMGINALFNPAGAMGAFGAEVPYRMEGSNYTNPDFAQGIGGSPVNSGIAEFSYGNEGLNYTNSDFTQGIGGSPINASLEALPPADMTITTTGSKIPGNIPTVPPATVPELTAIPSIGPGIGQGTGGENYGNEGRNYSTTESTQGAGGSPVNSSVTTGVPSAMSKFAEFMKSNPRLAMSLIGTITGKVFGGNSPSGSGGSGQGGMTATQAPKFQRQYVAPPAGYRPGFDPEHKYFTGIGNTNVGG